MNLFREAWNADEGESWPHFVAAALVFGLVLGALMAWLMVGAAAQ